MKWRSLEESGRQTDVRSLREIFAERKELIAKYVPAETQAIHAQAVAEFKQRNLAAKRSSGRREGAFIRTSRSQRQDRFFLRLARQRTTRTLLHSRTMVPVLRRTDGSDEPRRSADRTGWSDSRRDLSADGEAGVLHARSAQAALSSSIGCGQQSRAPVWPDLSRPGDAGGDISSGVRQPAVHERR